MPELDKTYTPADVEARWYQKWLDDQAFAADPARVSDKRPAYSIVIPPPNVTGILTLGHVLNNTIQDILARRARMLGKEVLWLPGTDHAGIATQNVVEKTLKKQGAIKHRDDLGREKLVEKIWEWKEKHGGIIIQQLKKLGASCDWSRERFTMDPDYSQCVLRVFVDLYRKGLIYRGRRMVNWCPSSLTALSDEEVIMKSQNATMYYFQVEVIDDDSNQKARPRAVDITAQQEETLRHEHCHADPRTGLSSYITGPRFDERAGAGLAAANRRTVGAAKSLLGQPRSGGTVAQDRSARGGGLRSLQDSEGGIAAVTLESLGIQRSPQGALGPIDASLQPLKPGAEAQPFADTAGGVVYKVFAADENGFIGRKTRITLQSGARPHVDFEPSNAIEALEKLNLLHEIGGVPTEIVGATEDGSWIIKQPLCTAITIDELGAARAEAVGNVGGVQVNEYGLGDIRIVWHRGRAWVITDLHVKNIVRDSEGRVRIMDALIMPVTEELHALPSVRAAIEEAKSKSDEAGASAHAQKEFSLFPAAKKKTLLTIATTRPEVIPGDTAIAVNPKDPRYAHLIGKHARRPLPLENQEALPIIGDEHVDFEFGTGVLKVTPAHDKADFEIAQRHGLPLVDVMHPNGTMNLIAGKDLAGMDRVEARKKAAELLREMGSLVKEEPYQNNVGYSERADVQIEPRLSDQWFLKYPSQEAARACVADGGAHAPSRAVEGAPAFNTKCDCEAKNQDAARGVDEREARAPLATREGACAPRASAPMRFFPDRWAKVYDHWMGNLQDWCISRQLWWGHRIPVWHKSVTINDYQLDADVFGWSGLDYNAEENAKAGRVVRCIRQRDGLEVDPESDDFRVSDTKNDQDTFDVYVATADEEDGRKLEPFGFVRDSDVLDTWFSSWLWPFATMGWPEKTDTLSKFYPTTDLVTGPDIIFFWVARMIMAGYEWMGELPFKNVYFTGIIRDKQGRKMSKSLGNSPDPLELISKYSADALRFGIMRSAPLGQDILFDEKNVELGRNFCTKLWNAARFRQMQSSGDWQSSPSDATIANRGYEEEINPALLSSDDKWILLRLNVAINEVTTSLEEYRFSDATNTLYRFFWSEYCDWYVEASKAVLQGADADRKANTLAVIDFVLGHTLRLFHPFLPFITEELWHGMGFNADMPENQGGKSIMFAPWPKPLSDDELAHFGILPEDEQAANDKYKTVELGRGLKSTFNINKKVRFVLKPANELPAHEIEVLRILLNAEPLDVDAAFTPKKGTPVSITPLGELFLPLDGIIDVDAERARVTKEIAKVESELTKVRAKLADENFTGKVPQKVLDEHKQREADWSAQFEKLKGMLEALG